STAVAAGIVARSGGRSNRGPRFPPDCSREAARLECLAPEGERMPSLEGLTIRPIGSVAEYDACEDLQRRAFRYADLDVVPTNELISADASGGLVLGAFAEGRAVGFCFGLSGRDHRRGEVYHYSRMVAVDPDFRGRGVAQALKRAQREA